MKVSKKLYVTGRKGNPGVMCDSQDHDKVSEVSQSPTGGWLFGKPRTEPGPTQPSGISGPEGLSTRPQINESSLHLTPALRSVLRACKPFSIFKQPIPNSPFSSSCWFIVTCPAVLPCIILDPEYIKPGLHLGS